LARLHEANGIVRPTEEDDAYGELVYRMKYWYLLRNDPEDYAEELIEGYKLFRGYEPEWKVLRFDPTIDYWNVDSFRYRHDDSYHTNNPSDCILWRQNIDSVLEWLPDRYCMLFDDDFDFDARYPQL
jgi:hypothetical protein